MKSIRKITILERVWFKFILKENEFHKSLSLDPKRALNMNYRDRLDRKREVAHILSMSE